MDDLETSSVLAWIVNNNMVTENRKPVEFADHRFLLAYLADDHPHKSSKKSSQIGETVCEVLDDFHLAIKRGMNVIHTLHTSDVLQGFVTPKVNPLIQLNPAISRELSNDSQGLKQFKHNFVYFRGASAESQAINISADVLKIDEKDRSNPSVVEIFETRLDFSEFKWIREFSNPSSVGYGVDETYSRSDQRHWFMKCHRCGHESWIDFEKSDELNHYVDIQRQIYACGKCHKELSRSDRTDGRWIAKWPTRTAIHGYWFSQMMAPWFEAAEIIKKYDTQSTETFFNFVLGKAYTQADLLIDRDSIMKAVKPKELRLNNVVMGSDIGKPMWYWLGTPDGVFKHGTAENWDELEYLFKSYHCEAWVMDAMPEFTKVQEMIRKYPGKAFACYFNKDRADVGMIRWQEGEKRGLVYADRTKVIDRIVTEINSNDIQFRERAQDIEQFISHASNMYRTVETDTKGKIKVDWQTKEGRPDHLVFALVYWRIALERVFSGLNAGVVETGVIKTTAPTVHNGKIPVAVDVKESWERAMRQ